MLKKRAKFWIIKSISSSIFFIRVREKDSLFCLLSSIIMLAFDKGKRQFVSVFIISYIIQNYYHGEFLNFFEEQWKTKLGMNAGMKKRGCKPIFFLKIMH